jgi:hypothetical protein
MTASGPRSRHGLRALKARVTVRGLQALDHRTVAARGLLAWRSDLVDDLGGEAEVSAQQMALVEAAVRTRLYVEHLDAWIMEYGSLVNARRRSVHPVVRERQQLVDSLLLRAHGLIHKISRTHRYRLTPKGQLLTAALFAARDATLKQLIGTAA